MSQTRQLPPAFFVNGRPDVARAVQTGVNWLRDWTKEHGGVPLIITQTGESEGRILQHAPQAGNITRWTIRTIHRSPWDGGPVLVVWANDKILARVADVYKVAAVCAVLDSLDRAPLWLKSRQPVEIGGAKSVLPPIVVVDRIVEIALEHLTNFVNLGTDLVDPSDRSCAIDVVRSLHFGRRQLSPDDAYAWAIQHGWHPRGAGNLRELVIGVAEDKRYRQADPPRSPTGMLAMWAKQALKETES
jgi:hypothetical protein